MKVSASPAAGESDGIRGKLSFVGELGCQRGAKRDVTGHIVMADGSYRTV